MDVIPSIKAAERFAVDNSPAILTGIGVAGTLATALLTGKATLRAAELITQENWERRKHELDRKPWRLDTKEAIALVWKGYIPAAATLTITITAIIMANRVGTKRAAAVAAAYAVTQQAYTEYREKIVERLGSRKEEEIRAEIATDRTSANPPQQIIIMGTQVTCFDAFSGRYFPSDMETMRRAMNDINYALNNAMYACLTDFYSAIGLDPTLTSDDIGWNVDKPLEIRFASVLTPDGRPALSIEYDVHPIRGFCRMS